MTPDEFRAYGHRVIDWIADYRADLAARRVMAATEPGAVKAALPGEPPAAPEPFDSVLRDLDAILCRG
jgi:aromatic-L-amino-acid decarboxylase